MAVQNMTDAPRISSADELDRAVTHAPLFEAVKSPRLKALLEETLQRMSGLGEDAESQYQRALAALRKEFKADATEMEGAAVAQICWQRRVPCLILRSLSDSAGAKAQENVLLFEKSAAQNAALLVAGIVGRLEAQ